jgi:transcriptional regulator of arginine metabolism
MKKVQRHLKIREIISQQAIETQEELVEQLQRAGCHVTQATISRDIKELHLSKVSTFHGMYKYSFPGDKKFNPVQKLKRMLKESFVHIDHSENLLVIRTLPGHAHAVAELIDQLEWEEIMGTIAGDNTILLICRNNQRVSNVVQRFQQMV